MATEVHVYGVVAAEDARSLPAGARGVVHGDVAAVVAGAEGASLPAARALREHWRVLEEIVRDKNVLPIRFGTVMASDEAVVDDLLAPSHDGLAAGLEALAGKVQVSVKGDYVQDSVLREVVAADPAIARLQAEVGALPEAASYAKRIRLGELVSAAVERRREQDAALVLERLEPLAVASRRDNASGMEGAVNVAFLVERDRLEAFAEEAAALAGELRGRIELRSVGPLPAYGFTPEGVGAWA